MVQPHKGILCSSQIKQVQMSEKKQKSTHVSVILLNSKTNQSIKQWSEQSVKRKKLKDI